MFFLSFTAPAKQRPRRISRPPRPAPSRWQTIITLGLFALWLVLMVFGGLTYLQPAWLQDLSRSGRRVEAATLKSYGDDFLRRGNYAMAAGQYLGALKVAPDRVDVRLNLATAWREMGNVDEAMAILRDVLRGEISQRDRAFACYSLGVLSAKQGDTSEAIAYYEQVTGVGVDPRQLYIRLASLYLGASRFEEARATFSKALASQLDVTLPYRSMLQNARETYADDEQRAAAIDKLLARDAGPDQLARYDLQTIRHMQEADIEVAETHNRLAFTYTQLGKTDEAAKHLHQVLKIMPDNEGARKNLLILQGMREDGGGGTAGP